MEYRENVVSIETGSFLELIAGHLASTLSLAMTIRMKKLFLHYFCTSEPGISKNTGKADLLFTLKFLNASQLVIQKRASRQCP